jgi:hypothetical protein
MVKSIMDKMGICASGLCLIHCLATPVALALFPTVSSDILGSNLIHILFGIVVVLLSLAAIIPNCRSHEHKDIFYIALTGASLIIIAVIFGHDLGEMAEHAMTITGSILLISAHLKNIKVRHGKCEESTTECAHSHQ